MSNIDKVLPEFAGDILIGRIFAGQLHGDSQEIQRIHGHPAGAVRLFNVAAGRQGSAAVEDSNVVEAQESALEDVHSVGVLAIDPPGEIEQQLVEDTFQKF